MTRNYGYAPRGELVKIGIKGRKFARKSIVGARCGEKHFAMECYSGTMNGEFFEKWFEEKLIPELPKNSIVIMDNAPFHRKKNLAEIANRHKIALMFLPPYSPDLNPIEHSWANMKRQIRSSFAPTSDLASAMLACFS